jgi:hypothetical protein
LCFWFVQITRTTPARRTILHLSQIFFTDALTFIARSGRFAAVHHRQNHQFKTAAASRQLATAKTASSKPRRCAAVHNHQNGQFKARRPFRTRGF